MIGSLALLVLALAGSGTGPKPATVPATQARIGAVGLQAKEAAVRQAFGEPLRVTSTQDDAADAPGKELVYREMTVYLVAGEVYRLACRSALYATPAGVRVGDAEASVVAAYGPTSPFTADGDSVLRYNIKGSDCWLDFRIQKGHVVEILIWFDYV